MSERFLRFFSGINNLKSVFYGRLIIGTIFVIYGFLAFYFGAIGDLWVKWGILLAFLGIGTTFVLDGQSLLREYFSNDKIEVLKSKITTKEINWNKIKINFLGFYLFFTLILFVSIGIIFYLSKLENKIILSLIIIACSGGIGGTLYSIRGFYQSLGQEIFDIEKWMWWYIFHPIMSAVIGIFVYFLIVGGLLSIGNVSEINYSKGLMFYSAIAFLAGFSFTQFANKLEELASTIFAKKEDKKK